jgi:hypothetical protein
MSAKDIENELTQYWAYLDKLPEDLKTIVQTHWDYTGRPTGMNTLTDVTIELLNKNAKIGFSNFENDMNLVFENKIPKEDLVNSYNIFAAGIKFLGNELTQDNVKKPTFK